MSIDEEVEEIIQRFNKIHFVLYVLSFIGLIICVLLRDPYGTVAFVSLTFSILFWRMVNELFLVKHEISLLRNETRLISHYLLDIHAVLDLHNLERK